MLLCEPEGRRRMEAMLRDSERVLENDDWRTLRARYSLATDAIDRLGRPRECLDWLSVYPQEEWATKEGGAAGHSLRLRVRALTALGRSSEGVELAERFGPEILGVLRTDDILRLFIAADWADALLALGRAKEAVLVLEPVVRDHEQAGSIRKRGVWMAYCTLARTYSAAGRAADARRELAVAEEIETKYHAARPSIGLARARAALLSAEGKHAEAATVLERWENAGAAQICDPDNAGLALIRLMRAEELAKADASRRDEAVRLGARAVQSLAVSCGADAAATKNASERVAALAH